MLFFTTGIIDFNIKKVKDKYTYLFLTSTVDFTGEITMHGGGAGPVSPFTVSGLEPGMEYCVYAVVTNGAYDTATEVSQSKGLICSAGV